MSHPFFAGLQYPRVIAHRGWLSPELVAQGSVENSFAAVAAAVALGADIIESDCHVTADGVPVLVHDSDLLRVVGDPRAIAEVSLPELKRVFADRGGLLTLHEAFTEFPGVRFNIDIKAEFASEPAGQLLGRYGRYALVNSFSDSRRMHALATAEATVLGLKDSAAVAPATASGMLLTVKLIIAMLLGPFGRGWAHRILEPLDAVQIPEKQYGVRVLTPALIRAAHQSGSEVHVWTVNDPQRMRELVALGVDGIVTDHADIALRDRPTWVSHDPHRERG